MHYLYQFLLQQIIYPTQKHISVHHKSKYMTGELYHQSKIFLYPCTTIRYTRHQCEFREIHNSGGGGIEPPPYIGNNLTSSPWSWIVTTSLVYSIGGSLVRYVASFWPLAVVVPTPLLSLSVESVVVVSEIHL